RTLYSCRIRSPRRVLFIKEFHRAYYKELKIIRGVFKGVGMNCDNGSFFCVNVQTCQKSVAAESSLPYLFGISGYAVCRALLACGIENQQFVLSVGFRQTVY